MYEIKNIKLARDSRGISQKELAEKTQLSPATISKIESGAIDVSEKQIRTIATALGYPVSFFSKVILPINEDTLCYRKRKTMATKDITLLESKLAILSSCIDDLQESIELPNLTLPHIEPTQDYQPDEIAFRIRQFLKISKGAIDNLINILELNGIIVVPIDINGSEKFDGLSILTSRMNTPVIWLNDNMPNDRKRFTLAHELGHIIMHLRSQSLEKSEKEKDEEADLFAAEFLLPRTQCENELWNLRYKDLALKKAYWKVSKAFLIQRAAQLKCITEQTKTYLFVTLGRNNERKNEKGWVSIDQPQSLRKMTDLHLNELGYSMEELSEWLGISTTDITKDLQQRGIKKQRIILLDKFEYL